MAEGEVTEEQISHKLTDVERERMQGDLLVALDREEAILAEKKDANKEFGARIKSVRATIKGYREALETGTEQRTVEVFETADLKGWRILKRDLDTKELVSERAMTAEELGYYRQPALFGDTKDDEVPHVIRRKPKAVPDEMFDDGLDEDEDDDTPPAQASSARPVSNEPEGDEGGDDFAITDPGALSQLLSEGEREAAEQAKKTRKPRR